MSFLKLFISILFFLGSFQSFATMSRYTKKMGLGLSYESLYSLNHFYLSGKFSYRFTPKNSGHFRLSYSPEVGGLELNYPYEKDDQGNSRHQFLLGVKPSYLVSFAVSHFLIPDAKVSPYLGLGYFFYAELDEDDKKDSKLESSKQLKKASRKPSLNKVAVGDDKDPNQAHFIYVYAGYQWQFLPNSAVSFDLNMAFKVHSEYDLGTYEEKAYLYPSVSLDFFF